MRGRHLIVALQRVPSISQFSVRSIWKGGNGAFEILTIDDPRDEQNLAPVRYPERSPGDP